MAEIGHSNHKSVLLRPAVECAEPVCLRRLQHAARLANARNPNTSLDALHGPKVTSKAESARIAACVCTVRMSAASAGRLNAANQHPLSLCGCVLIQSAPSGTPLSVSHTVDSVSGSSQGLDRSLQTLPSLLRLFQGMFPSEHSLNHALDNSILLMLLA